MNGLQAYIFEWQKYNNFSQTTNLSFITVTNFTINNNNHLIEAMNNYQTVTFSSCSFSAISIGFPINRGIHAYNPKQGFNK